MAVSGRTTILAPLLGRFAHQRLDRLAVLRRRSPTRDELHGRNANRRRLSSIGRRCNTNAEQQDRSQRRQTCDCHDCNPVKYVPNPRHLPNAAWTRRLNGGAFLIPSHALYPPDPSVTGTSTRWPPRTTVMTTWLPGCFDSMALRKSSAVLDRLAVDGHDHVGRRPIDRLSTC